MAIAKSLNLLEKQEYGNEGNVSFKRDDSSDFSDDSETDGIFKTTQLRSGDTRMTGTKNSDLGGDMTKSMPFLPIKTYKEIDTTKALVDCKMEIKKL